MKRRTFVKNISLGSILLGVSLESLLTSCNTLSPWDEFHLEVEDLLKVWCDGMIENQMIDPDNLEIHGALDCPSCEHIHGRCMDAVYPFLYMADHSGDKKYMNAAILVMEWAENNVSHDNGSWSVIPNPKSWKGITVFGAIALAEALHFHGHVLDEEILKTWTNRLGRAAEYVYQNFDLTFTNINYGATAIYGLNLFGRVLKNEKYINRSRELASGIKPFFTTPNHLLLGEGKPSTKKSEKGLYAIDLGYNVEESLNNLVLYAVEENDEELKQLLTKSLNTHLEFMLPDGAWDNSWGTRQFKWSYWGSRTTDGCQPGFGFLADNNPAYTSALVKNTRLLKECTNNGLIHGGPHYVHHGIKPCIHHTFAHAKPLATILNLWDQLPANPINTPLPRENEYGLKYMEEIDTYLLAHGPWIGTITGYDAIYYKGNYRQATGGALSVLYHKEVGLLLAASMAEYKMAEKNNQQPNPGKDFALTPRIETFKDNDWYTNIYDLKAQLNANEQNNDFGILAHAKLKNEAMETVSGTASEFDLEYKCNPDKFIISAKTEHEINAPTSLILPIISNNSEKIQRIADNELTIQKTNGLVRLKANVPLLIKTTESKRTFNMVPGVEAIPIIANFPDGLSDEKIVRIQIIVTK